MHIFDAHTHFFSRVFYETLAGAVGQGSIDEHLATLERRGIEVPSGDTDAHLNRLVKEMDEHGIDRAVTFASVPEEMETVGAAAASSGGRLVPYAMVNPTDPETVRQLAACQPQLGFKGMILFPQMHDYGIGDVVVQPTLDLAREHDLVVFVHCGLLRVPTRPMLGLDPDFPLARGHPEDLIPVAKSRPDQMFIVPHFGAGFFDEFLRLGKSCKNVYADTAGSNSWGMFQAPPLYLEDLFEQAVEAYGIERILFGSDTGGFPRGYRRDVLDAQVRAMVDAGIAYADRELILGGNLAKLLEV